MTNEEKLEHQKRTDYLSAYETQKKFYKIFEVSMSKFLNYVFYEDYILLFNAVAFKEWLQVPNSISMKDYLIQRYGLEVSNFINSLI